jgi:D-tyrosyl-tRNA(Tyr) deacylase
MRALIQRVTQTSVSVDRKIKSEIGKGLLVFLGIEESNSNEDIDWLAGKISRLRIFPDEQGVMNRSVMEVNGDILLISQFTLHAGTKKGNRPSYIRAARPETAIPLYEKFIAKIEALLNKQIGTGEFGAHMEVSLINDGPVTIFIDTKNRE